MFPRRRAVILIFALSILVCYAQQPTSRTVKDAVDSTISGVELREPQKTTLTRDRPSKFLTRDGDRFVQYYNATGRQMLTLIATADSDTADFRSYQLSRIDKPFMIDTTVLKEVSAFTTGKGIRLGMTQKEVVGRLGSPLRKEKNDVGALVLTYAADYPLGSGDQQQKGHLYTGRYSFARGRLIDILVSID